MECSALLANDICGVVASKGRKEKDSKCLYAIGLIKRKPWCFTPKNIPSEEI